MYFKRSVLALVICGLPAFATPVDPAQMGAAGFKAVTSSSRINRAACADKRIICMAQNQSKTKLVLSAAQFLSQAAASLGRLDPSIGAGRSAVPLLASNAVLTQRSPAPLASGLAPLGLLTAGGGIVSTGTSTLVVGAAVQPAAVPLPAAGYVLMLALSLLLLVQRQTTIPQQCRAVRAAARHVLKS